MKLIVVNREPMDVIGIKAKTNTRELIVPDLWEQFFKRIPEIDTITTLDCSLGICIGDSFQEKQGITYFEYLAGRILKKKVEKIPEGMVVHKVPGGLYAVFTHQGSVENLSETYAYIYDEWLEESVYELDERDQMEWYDKRFQFRQEDSELDIHIPIKPIHDFSLERENE